MHYDQQKPLAAAAEAERDAEAMFLDEEFAAAEQEATLHEEDLAAAEAEA